MLTNRTIQNLINGVSQQPPSLRLSNQAQEQINAMSRVSTGLTKRPSVELIPVYDVGEESINSAMKLFNPDPMYPDLKYIDTWNVASTVIRMNRLIGTQPTIEDILVIVHTTSGKLIMRNLTTGYSHVEYNYYLLGAQKSDIKFLLNGDTLYILNKKQTVTLSAGTFGDGWKMRANGGLGWISTVTFSTVYTLTVDLYNATTDALVAQFDPVSYTTPASSGTIADATIGAVLRKASTGLQPLINGKIISNFSGAYSGKVITESEDNWIRFRLTQGAAQTDNLRLVVKLTSDTQQTQCYNLNGQTTQLGLLPMTAPTGFTVKIDPDPTSSSEHYYMTYDKVVKGWYESKELINEQTIESQHLPLKITGIVAGGVYSEFSPVLNVSNMTIKAREIGDSEVNPHPNFIGKQLSDMFLFNNRLGFLAGNNIILSKVDEHDMFYRSSCAQVLANDRIDITATVPSAKFANLNYAVPFESNLMLFSNAGQYLLSTTTSFDLNKTALAMATEYATDNKCAPINLGSAIYFGVNRNGVSGVYDLSRKDGIGITAEEATGHISNYIKGNIIEMSHSTPEDILFLISDEEANTVYVQNRFVRQTVLEQNAWHKWSFPHKVLSAQVSGSYLYVTMTTGANNEYLLFGRVDITVKKPERPEGTTITFNPLIDMAYKMPVGGELTSTWSGNEDKYWVPAEILDDIIGVNSGGGIVRGIAAINEALEEEEMWVGVPYTMTYTLSQQVPSIQGDKGQDVLQYAKLLLRSMKIAYQNTGKFKVTVKPKGRTAFVTEFDGYLLGDDQSILGVINLTSGMFRFPVNCKADECTITISSDYPYPVTLNALEWQGTLINKGQRI